MLYSWRNIVAAYKHSVHNGHGFSIAALTPMIARMFKITSLDNLIPIRLTTDNERQPFAHGYTRPG